METSKMEQVIRAEAADYRIRSRIEHKYDVLTQNEGEEILFQIQEKEPVSALQLKPYSAAIRRIPALPRNNRLLSMADMTRTDTSIITLTGENESYQRRALEAAIAYQDAMGIPCIFASGEKEQLLTEYGFGTVLKLPSYRINQELLSDSLLLQARISGSIEFVPSYIKIAALRRNGLMELSHFANTVLCRKYGLFMIRGAVYYEKMLQELEADGGGIYLIMEYGNLKGYFAVDGKGEVRESIFENDLECERYLIKQSGKEKHVMARVGNLTQLLRYIAGKGKVTIALQLTDDVNSANNGYYIWYLDDDGSRIERIAEKDEEIFRPELNITIGQLITFLLGYDKLKESLKFDSIYVINPVFINEI